MTNTTTVTTTMYTETATHPASAMPAELATTKQQVPLSTTTLPTTQQQSPSLGATCENRLQAALEHARRLTQMYGYRDANVAVAWETVEELRTAHRERLLSTALSCQAAFERYCTEDPHALECRSYDC